MLKKKGNKEELCSYFENGNFPCGLGTYLTKKGHIIRGIGIVVNDDGKKFLKVSDPYGYMIQYELDVLFDLGVPTALYLENC